MKKRCMFIFGTRPEAIKMAPVIKAFQADPSMFDVFICTTGQHKEMLAQVLDFFELSAHFDLEVMTPGQSLFSLTAKIIENLKDPLERFAPDFVFVHGDTTTAMAASIAGFYYGAKICHVEAGLRTFDKLSPFPEEANRQIVSRVADFHFAPTENAKQNLINEGIAIKNILVTGNTVIDALFLSVHKVLHQNNADIDRLSQVLDSSKKRILVTGHRRENHGQGFVDICHALRDLATMRDDIEIVYPVHLNPKVKGPVYELLTGLKNVLLIDPLSYPAFVWLMESSYIIITDSGGVQEEAPSLGKPVLVMRDTTERPEAVEAGTVVLVGTDRPRIIQRCTELLDNKQLYASMSALHNPYGDGIAATRIFNFISAL